MAKILGYINQVRNTQSTADWFAEILKDDFIVTFESGFIKFVNSKGNGFKLGHTSNNSIQYAYMINNNIDSGKLDIAYTSSSEPTTNIKVFKTKSGIMITITNDTSWSRSYTAYTTTVTWNKNTESCVIVSLCSESPVMNDHSTMCHKSIGGVVKSETIAIGNQCIGYPLSPYVILEEITQEEKKSGIYVLRQGRVVNGSVSDGNKNIFIAHVLGLED